MAIDPSYPIGRFDPNTRWTAASRHGAIEDEDSWAALPDSRLPIAPSLAVIDGINERWLALWHALGEDAFARIYTHAASGPLTIEAHLHFFAWHARHHIAHVSTLREREGW